jgi:adenylate cyclase
MAEVGSQRRLAAILAADVVGYSRLMERDEAGTLAVLKERRAGILNPTVARHHGRVVKVMGDGVLIEFGSAVNAVACAVDIQKQFETANEGVVKDRHIVLRVGVNLGDVVVEGSDLFGDGVIIAVRLETMANPGEVYLSGSVHEQVSGKLDVAFADLGFREIKNNLKPLRVFKVKPSGAVAVRSSLALPNKSSIAVLPFTNMSSDPEQHYFSDGITEDIITELSRFRDIFIIARNSSFIYKGRAVDIKQVGRELGVAFVLEGSVRRSGNQVRITAQLIDSETGNHIWADRFDRELADVFAVQDEITKKIVGMLTLGLEDDALIRAQRKPPESLIAYDYWLRGKRLLWTVGKNNLEARKNFEKAARIDPKFSRAYSGLAVTWQMEALDFPFASEATAAYANAYEFAQKALALDDADYQAHIALAWPLLYRHDYERMKRHIDRALDLNPNDADTLANAVYLLVMYGEPERAVTLGEAAMRLNPRYPDWYISFLAAALFSTRRFPEALEMRRKAPDHFIDSLFSYGALLAHMGQMDEARDWAKRAVARLRERPGSSGNDALGPIALLMQNNPYRRSEDAELFESGMRLAGVPD